MGGLYPDVKERPDGVVTLRLLQGVGVAPGTRSLVTLGGSCLVAVADGEFSGPSSFSTCRQRRVYLRVLPNTSCAFGGSNPPMNPSATAILMPESIER